MKLSKIVLSTAIAAAFAVNVQAASNGTINFTGKIVDKTCDIKIDGNPSPATVTLPDAGVDVLNAASKTAGDTDFVIQLSGCTGSASVTKATTHFDGGSTVNSTTKRLINTAPVATAATNVELELLDKDRAGSSAIKIGDSSQKVDNHKVTLGTTGANLNYTVRYYATAAATTGDVKSSVNFTIHYE